MITRLIQNGEALARYTRQQPGYFVHRQLFSSLEMYWWYTAMRQDGLPDLAHDMHMTMDNRSNPTQIEKWCYDHGYEPSPTVLFAGMDIYRALLSYQQRKEGFLWECLQTAVEHAGGPLNLQFVAVRDLDFIWGSGMRTSSTLRLLDDLPGFNLLGELLTAVARESALGQIGSPYTVSQLWNVAVLPERKKTCLILSDSMLRQLTYVQQGTISPISGGTLRDAVVDAQDRGLWYRDYEYVIIAAGINDARKSPNTRKEIVKKLLTAVSYQIQNGADPSRILVSLPPPHPSVPQSVEYSFFIESRVEALGIRCLNWSGDAEIPFIQMGDGAWNPRLSEFDGFHINHAGLRELWKRWCHIFPELKLVTYGVSSENYQQL